MPIRFQVQCVNKSDRYNAYERIKNIGGNYGGSPWRRSQQDAINDIESNLRDYYVSKSGHEVNVIVAVSRWGNKYIKTASDGDQPDNLLALPECL